MLDTFPMELFLKVAHYFDRKSICQLSMSCSSLNYYGNSDAIWQPLFMKDLRTKQLSQRFQKFLQRFAEKCSWKTCYRTLYQINQKIYPNFWDDDEEIKNLEMADKCLDTVSISGAVKLLVSVYLKDFKELWALRMEETCALTQIMSSVPPLDVRHVVQTLLDVAEGPPRSGEKCFYKISSSMVSMFMVIKEMKHSSNEQG